MIFGKDKGALGKNDLDEDDLENSMSLAAIEAELKPKVLETFDTITPPRFSGSAALSGTKEQARPHNAPVNIPFALAG